MFADDVLPGEVSLGELYCIYAAALQLTPRHGPYGFDDPLRAGGKLMGLAAYDRGRNPVPPLLRFADDRLVIELESLVDHLEQRGFVQTPPTLPLVTSFGFQLSGSMEFVRRTEELTAPRYIELAGEAQRLLEEGLLVIARRLHERTGARALCAAGGTMLNVTACARLLNETPFERVFVQPAANDAGNAIGAALYGYRELIGGERRPYLTQPYSTCLGRSYSAAEIEAAIERVPARAAFSRQRVDAQQDKVAALCARLLDGEIVALFDGRSEFGPRALGRRSLLASPRDASMREQMNRLKQREWYRPVAPIVLERAFAEYFAAPFVQSPFMTLAAQAREPTRLRAPAVVHVDGSARPQTIAAERDPLLFELLVELERRGEPPILINSSFNVGGEPIVETPADALASFAGCELLRTLLIGDCLLAKVP